MSNNTNLTKELALKLIKSQEVLCPKCRKTVLVSRYMFKSKNTEYKCPACGEVYHPCKMI
jgi:predicted RNA-binding Zn-ribbon protein involved in translation (DUF1610 family)